MEVKLAQVLNRELKVRNESVNSLASACGIPSSTLHNWVQGVLPTAKNLHHIKALADHLGLTVTTLLFNVKDNNLGNSILFSSQFVDGDMRYRLTIEKESKD